VVARAFTAAGIPVCKEPTGLRHTDGKRPDGMTMIPWWAGKPAVWDVTVVCTSAGSYLNSSALEAGAAAEFAASRKMANECESGSKLHFLSDCCRDSRATERRGTVVMCDLGWRILASSGDVREMNFLFQRVSVVVQHFNAILLHDSFCVEYRPN